MGRRKRRHFTDEFKPDTARLVGHAVLGGLACDQELTA